MDLDLRSVIDLGIPLLLGALVVLRVPGQWSYLFMLLFCLSIAWACCESKLGIPKFQLFENSSPVATPWLEPTANLSTTQPPPAITCRGLSAFEDRG